MLQSRRPSSVPPELIPNDSPEKKVVKKLRKKGKVGGLVVDDVTELSNEELKVRFSISPNITSVYTEFLRTPALNIWRDKIYFDLSSTPGRGNVRTSNL